MLLNGLVQGAPVTSQADWRAGLAASLTSPQPGFCLSRALTTSLALPAPSSPDLATCCPPTRQDCLCFTAQGGAGAGGRDVCLPARAAVAGARIGCDSCDNTTHHCLVPRLEGNTTRLLVVSRNPGPEFLFLGSPAEVWQAASVSEYRARVSYLAPVALPDCLARQYLYLFPPNPQENVDQF